MMEHIQITAQAVAEAIAVERERCAKIVCPDCAKGINLDRSSWDHILETIQGHASWTRACLAKTIRGGHTEGAGQS